MAKSNEVGMFMTIVEAFTEFNGAFLNTLKGLSTAPGDTIRGFLAEPTSGQYINPFRFAVLTISAYVVCASLLGMDMSADFVDGFEAGKGSTLTDSEKQGAEFTGNLLDNSIMFVTLISLVPTAWLMSKLFSSSGQNIITCYKVALYAYGMSTAIYLLLALPIVLIFPDIYEANQGDIMGLLTLITVPYIVWFYTDYFQVSILSGIWKTIVTMT